MTQGVLRNGLRVVDVGAKLAPKTHNRPLKGFIIYPKGHSPSSNLIEWIDGGSFRFDGKPDKLDLMKTINSVPMTIQQLEVYEFLLERAYNSIKKAVETHEELETVIAACKLELFENELVIKTKASIDSTEEEDKVNLVKILFFLERNGQIEIFGIDTEASFVPKLYIL